MIVYIFFLHFIADFLLQSREMGQKKSQEFGWLILHILTQFAVLLVGLWGFWGLEKSLIFTSLYCVLHGTQDWYIWRAYKFSVLKRFKELTNFKYWEDSWFYTTIGLDQLLHFSTLYVLWEMIK